MTAPGAPDSSCRFSLESLLEVPARVRLILARTQAQRPLRGVPSPFETGNDVHVPPASKLSVPKPTSHRSPALLPTGRADLAPRRPVTPGAQVAPRPIANEGVPVLPAADQWTAYRGSCVACSWAVREAPSKGCLGG